MLNSRVVSIAPSAALPGQAPFPFRYDKDERLFFGEDINIGESTRGFFRPECEVVSRSSLHSIS